MPILYFDNIRGFKKTFLDLKTVNFFVGENSTGKTSVLKLIGILASQGFWRYGEFGNAEIDFGSFSEIITSPRTNQEFIEVGINEPENDEKSGSFFIKVKFIDGGYKPILKELCYKNDRVNLQIVIEGRILKYRYQNIDDEDLSRDIEFSKWLRDAGLGKLNFAKIPAEYIGIIPILVQLNSVIAGQLTKNKGKIPNEHSLQIPLPSFLPRFAWMSPLRAEPQESYKFEGLHFSPDGSHSPSVLREILGPSVKEILQKFGKDSGLFHDLSVKDWMDENKKGDNIYSDQVKAERFQLLVNINGQDRNIINVGYGVSQILPFLVEAIGRPNDTWFAIQQPEVHLHPKAQAALGDFIFKTNTLENQHFIIETHSDYLLDRYRIRLNRALRKKEVTERIAQVIFFSKNRSGNQLHVIELNPDGSYPERQPEKFRAFFLKEQFKLISI